MHRDRCVGDCLAQNCTNVLCRLRHCAELIAYTCIYKYTTNYTDNILQYICPSNYVWLQYINKYLKLEKKIYLYLYFRKRFRRIFVFVICDVKSCAYLYEVCVHVALTSCIQLEMCAIMGTWRENCFHTVKEFFRKVRVKHLLKNFICDI